MKLPFALATGVAWAAFAAAGSAQAGARGDHPMYLPHHGLPPVSGTIHMHPGAFGGIPKRTAGWAQGRGGYSQPNIFATPRRSYGPAMGYQGQAFQQLARGGGYGYAYTAAPRSVGWTGDGTGLVGLIGNGGNAYAGGGTGWGTADSATTGYAGGYQPSTNTEAPVQVAYGEPDLWSSQGGGAYGSGQYFYGAAPSLPYYSSGSPGRMAYYSSGSSAGPYGSPGGLGVYSSGAYGPGPRIIPIPGRRLYGRSMRDGCTCGPHIIHVGRPRHYANWY